MNNAIYIYINQFQNAVDGEPTEEINKTGSAVNGTNAMYRVEISQDGIVQEIKRLASNHIDNDVHYFVTLNGPVIARGKPIPTMLRALF